MTLFTVVRKLQAIGVDNTKIAQALVSLGNKKNWKLLTKTGETMLEMLKETSQILNHYVPIIKNTLDDA